MTSVTRGPEPAFEALLRRVHGDEVRGHPGPPGSDAWRWGVYALGLARGEHALVVEAVSEEPDESLARAVVWELVDVPGWRDPALSALRPGPGRDAVLAHVRDLDLRDRMLGGDALADVPVSGMSHWLQVACATRSSDPALLAGLAAEGGRKVRHVARERMREVVSP